MFDILTGKWWVVALRGILAILFGIVALVYPGATLLSLALVFGAYALIDGVFAIFAAIGYGGREAVWYVLEGILGIAVGIATFFYPNITAQALVYLIGFWAILTGIFEVVAGFELPVARDWLLALAGVLSILFGVLVFFNPGSGAVAIVWLIGIYALLFGVTMLVFGIRLHGLSGKLTPQTT
jgi:uncharacterized membrane protein HdeD (DUF308 family)